MTGHFLHSCGPRTRILGKIPACHEKGREREQRSAGQVISCLDIPSPDSLWPPSSPFISLRSVSSGCWAGWDYLGVGSSCRTWLQAFGVQSPLVWHLGLGGGGQVLSSLPMAAWILDDDIRASQQAH